MKFKCMLLSTTFSSEFGAWITPLPEEQLEPGAAIIPVMSQGGRCNSFKKNEDDVVYSNMK